MYDRNRDTFFEESLNEMQETPIIIAGIRFYPSEILYALDPVAYRTNLVDWSDAVNG
jgi:hypothetical protein